MAVGYGDIIERSCMRNMELISSKYIMYIHQNSKAINNNIRLFYIQKEGHTQRREMESFPLGTVQRVTL